VFNGMVHAPPLQVNLGRFDYLAKWGQAKLVKIYSLSLCYVFPTWQMASQNVKALFPRQIKSHGF
jgi:hypothetical protein